MLENNDILIRTSDIISLLTCSRWSSPAITFQQLSTTQPSLGSRGMVRYKSAKKWMQWNAIRKELMNITHNETVLSSKWHDIHYKRCVTSDLKPQWTGVILHEFVYFVMFLLLIIITVIIVIYYLFIFNIYLFNIQFIWINLRNLYPPTYRPNVFLVLMWCY